MQPDSPIEYIIPDYYTEHEGGIWKPWPGNYRISTDILNDLTLLGAAAIITNCAGKTIAYHSLCWQDLNGVTVRRWDCVNGWTRNGYND